MASENPIAKLILDSFADSGIEKPSILGQKLIDRARSLDKVELLNDEPDEEEIKVKFLRECEDSSNLGWMEYSSWNQFSLMTKEFFRLRLDPFLLDGVFFSYSSWLEHREDILTYEPNYSISIWVLSQLKGNFKLVILGDFNTSVDFLGPVKLNEMRKGLQESLIERVGLSKKGLVVKKESNG